MNDKTKHRQCRKYSFVKADALCKPARCVDSKSDLKVYVKELENGDKAIGLFDASHVGAKMSFEWIDAQLSGKQKLRDLWRQHDLGEFTDESFAEAPPHGALLPRVSPSK